MKIYKVKGRTLFGPDQRFFSAKRDAQAHIKSMLDGDPVEFTVIDPPKGRRDLAEWLNKYAR